MARLSVLLLATLFLVSCGRPPGFKAENHEFIRAQNVDGNDKSKAGETANPKKPGSVKRTSNRIQLKKTKSAWDKSTKNLTLSANVEIDGKDMGQIEFTGTREDSKIVLNTDNPDLKDSLKAQLFCTSEEETCENFFIDVIYKENDILYVDQMLPAQQEDTSKAPKKQKHDNESESFEFIDLEKLKTAGYIGISDQEARRMFNLSIPKEPSETKDDSVTPPQATPTPPPSRPPSLPPTVKPPIKDDGAARPGGKAEETEEDKVLRALEKFKSKNQVVNWPFRWNGVNGRLNRGINFRQIVTEVQNVGFKVVATDAETFGSFGLARVLVSLGFSLADIAPGRALHVTAVSNRNGGPTPKHDSHQNGTDIDIRFLRNNENLPSDIVEGGHVSTNFLVKEQWQLMKKVFQTKRVDIVFMDRAVKKALCEHAIAIGDYKRGDDNTEGAEVLRRIRHEDGHQNHFHIRVKCIKDEDQACGIVPYKLNEVGC